MSDEHNFEELTAPAATAKELGISVATLRKYSLIVEKVTGNSHYYQRTKQKARLYHEQDIQDIDAFHKLAQNNGLTLEQAARRIFMVSDSEQKQEREQAEKMTQNAEVPVDPTQLSQLLTALQQTIGRQNDAIGSLQQQLNRLEDQNKQLLEQNKTEKLADFDLDELNDQALFAANSAKVLTPEEKRAAVVADQSKSKEELHQEIMGKAKENAAQNFDKPRTLADMQVDPEKKHWWQRFVKF